MGFNKRTLTVALGIAVLILAVVQIVSMLGARLEVGDTFAPYSTLRADPLGMMALYNALDSLPHHDSLRFVRPIEELPDGAGYTLIIAGAPLGMDPPGILDAVDRFVYTGGRAVIAFHPLDEGYALRSLRRNIRLRDRAREAREKRDNPDEDATPAEETSEEVPAEESAPADETLEDESPPEDMAGPGSNDAKNTGGDDTGDDAEDDDGDTEDLRRLPPGALEAEDISERWKFDYGFEIPSGDPEATRHDGAPPLEDTLRVRTGLYFQTDNDAWTPVFVRDGAEEDENPFTVVMTRKQGAGSIVLCSDSYFLSNEALRNDRAPKTLDWLMGENTTLLFSETHLGNGQRDRIMTLVRRYRLHGVLAGLALIGGLFLWRNMTTLIPRRERALAAQTEIERTQHAGLDNLLVRFVPPAAIIATGVREWRHHFAKTPKGGAVLRAYEAMDDTADTPKDKETIVTMYNRLVQAARQRKS